MSLSAIARRPHWSAWLVCAWLTLPMLAGCNSKEEEPGQESQQPEDDNSEPLSNNSDREDEGDSQPRTASTGGNDNNDASTEWIGDIPFDVYYDRPLEIARNDQTIAVTTTTPGETGTPEPAETQGEPAPMVTPMPMSTATTGGAIDWEQVIPIEVLNEEVKQIRNRLSANLQTVATFNREQEANKLDAVVLSGLAAIAVLHPGDLNWKDKAPHIRDLANVIFVNSSDTGREPYAACEVAFEQIQTMLDGGPVPPELTADPARSPVEVADRFDLMYRFRLTSSHLKSNINSEARLKEDVPGVTRELSVLAGLATLVSMDGYGYADESDYQGHIATFLEAVNTSRTGAQLESFEQFSQGVAAIQKACNDCHQQYAFGTDAGI